MIVTEIHSRGLSNQLIDFLTSKSNTAFVLESCSERKITSDKSAKKYIDYIRELFSDSLININTFNVASNSLKNSYLAFNYLSKEEWNPECRDLLKSVLDIDKEDCYALTSVLCKMKKKSSPLSNYRYRTRFNLSAHALRRIYQRLSIDTNENKQIILDEFKFCAMFAEFYFYYFCDWNDIEFINKLSVPIPTYSGLFLCKLIKTKSGEFQVFARTFISDKDLREEQEILKRELLFYASKFENSSFSMISFPFARINNDLALQGMKKVLCAFYYSLQSILDELAEEMISTEQFGERRDFEVFKLKDRMRKDFSNTFKK